MNAVNLSSPRPVPRRDWPDLILFHDGGFPFFAMWPENRGPESYRRPRLAREGPVKASPMNPHLLSHNLPAPSCWGENVGPPPANEEFRALVELVLISPPSSNMAAQRQKNKKRPGPGVQRR